MQNVKVQVFRLLSPLMAVLIAGLAPVATADQPSDAVDYARYTAARLIPYADPQADAQPFSGKLRFHVSIGGKRHVIPMDTGTTGIMLSASDIEGYSPEQAAKHQQGWEFLSSSKILWVGHWIFQDVTFHDANGAPVAKARVRVLAVEKEARCLKYNEKTDGPNCPGTNLKDAKRGIAYMGVGFGREHDGQPQGTPDKNPFLKIIEIDGAPVAPGTMRSGYIITDKGVHVGLTATNTAGFVYTGLTGPKYSSVPHDWPQASICVAVDKSPCVPGSVLVDTGISHMYLTVTSQVSPIRVVKGPDPSVKGKLVPVLEKGSQVTIRFPGNDNPIAFYTFTVGDDANPLAPHEVIVSTNGAAAFVNTGRHFLRYFNVLYDADGGLFGLRWTGPANSPYGGQTPAR